jgi:phytoene dehydrogenase-like protein
MDQRAVVVGAGHNGLVAACLLAKRGVRVTVLERREIVGGACVTEELIPGFRVSSAAYSFSLFRPEILGALDLRRYGLYWYAKEPRTFVPLPDGRAFTIWRDGAHTLDEIRRISPHDAAAYPAWNAFWEEVAAIVRPIVMDPSPPTLAELEAELERRGKHDLFRMAITGSVADTVRHFFSSDEMQGLQATQGLIGTASGPFDPGTAFVMTYHAFGGELVDGAGTWAYVQGGMGSVTRALAACARDLGVEIRTGVDVESIVLDSLGRAGGVRVDGKTTKADLVLSNADPVRTFLRLLEPGSLDARFEERVRGIDTTGSVVKVNLALDGLPDFVAAPGTEPGPQHSGTICIAPSLAYLDTAHHDAVEGRPSREPFMEVFIQSVTDDSLAPAGKHVASCFAQYAPGSLDAGSWQEMRDVAGDAVVRTLARYAPNLPDIVLHREVLGPPDLEARFGLTGGNIFHGEITPGQILGDRLGPRTPIPGLYLCGSGAHPGGGVCGASGWHAANAALDDLR